MNEENDNIACMEQYGAEGMFGEQYTPKVSVSQEYEDNSVNEPNK